MLVEVRLGSDSLVIDLPEDVLNVLPFKSELIRWKEELYFTTPYMLKTEGVVGTSYVVPGKVYYWPPGKAFCIFYGFSEPYSEVFLLGDYVGPLSNLRRFKTGSVEVFKHVVADDLKDVVEVLSRLGYSTATPLDNGVRVVVASKYVGGVRIAFSVIKEDYGMYLESDTFYEYSMGFEGIRSVYRFKSKVRSYSNLVRFDLTEDNYLCLTSVVKDISSLERAVNDLERVYQFIFKELTIT
jgi:hypothetical protein